MLTNLYIKNYVLISELSIDFEKGFSSFTGETGAGKSILMDAIGLLCGDRIDVGSIRTNEQSAIVEGTFLFNENQLKVLAEYGFGDDNNVIVTREFDRNGKSICKLNHRNVTLSVLKETIGSFIDIHSQHENQYLLNNRYHIQLLDTYCDIHDLLEELKKAYREYTNKRDELDKLENQDLSLEQKEFLEYKVKEITEANLIEGEDSEIEEKLKVAASFEKIYNTLSKVIDSYEKDDGVLSLSYNSIKMLRNFDDNKQLADYTNSLDNSYYEIQNSIEGLKDYLSSIDFDESEINMMNERIYLINSLKRKYGNTITEIKEKLVEYNRQLDFMSDRDLIIDKMHKEVDELYNKFIEISSKVTSIRKEKAILLEENIIKELKQLQLTNANFKIDINETTPSALGIDSVEFLISMNPGEPLRPLQKVASGGELSRLMLGLKTIFNKLWGCSLVIFDEIDSGVSGSVAFSIGYKMKEISRNAQVFAVTHLSPVAAFGDNQYKVVKRSNDNETFSNIIKLDENQRIDELAAINNGIVTESSQESAKELLERARGVWRV